MAKEEQFTLDELGNWSNYLTKSSGTTDLDHGRAHNAANETGTITTTTGSSWISPAYDAAGNMTSGPRPGSETVRNHYAYDAWNRMISVKADSGGSPGTTIVCPF